MGMAGWKEQQELLGRNDLKHVNIINNKKTTEFHGNFNHLTNENHQALPAEMTNSSVVPRMFLCAKNRHVSLELHEKLQAEDE